MRRVNVAGYVIGVVLFLLAGLGVSVEQVGALDLIAFGLAAFALAHILPG